MLMRGLKDPRIGFTTITDVHVTGDLREATIYVPCLVLIRKNKIPLSH